MNLKLIFEYSHKNIQKEYQKIQLGLSKTIIKKLALSQNTMSQDPQSAQNYSQINLDVIKNTKLFQKFMQNKSGLTVNNQPQRSNQIVGKNRKTQGKQFQNKKHIQLGGKKEIYPNINFQSIVQQTNQQSLNNYALKPTQKHIKQDKLKHSPLKQQSYVYNHNYSQFSQQNQKQIETQNTNQGRRKRNFINPYAQNKQINTPAINKTNEVGPIRYTINEENNFNRINTNNINRNSNETVNNISQRAFVLPYQETNQKNQMLNRSLSHHQTTYANLNENDYRQKYEALLKKHQQLKLQCKNQNKSRKKQFNDWQHQIQVIKQKLFDVQSRQDSLLIQNQRIKQKWEHQNLQKMKIQQENKELGYKIKQLQDQINMKQSALKQKADQTNYWKAQAQSIKQDFNMLKLNFQKKCDQYNIIYGDYNIIKKQRDNKDYLLQDLRRNISSLVEQNSAAKDQLFTLVTKLYQYQQQNQMLKNDLKRLQSENVQINYMRDRIQSTHLERVNKIQTKPSHNQSFMRQQIKTFSNQNQQTGINVQNRQSLTEQQKPGNQRQRRRGQFARQRGQIARSQRPQKDDKTLNISNKQRQVTHHNHSFTQNSQQSKQFKPTFGNNKINRIQQISEQLNKIKDMKAMNGAIRRRKIDLERQLQQLQTS